MPRKSGIWDSARGHRIKMARHDRGLSQTKLAKLLLCTQSHISDIERGKDFSVSLAKRLLQVLRISHKYLDGGESLHIK